MLFDLNISGHHVGYLYHLVVYWQQNRFDGVLILLVSPDLFIQHPHFLALTDNDAVQLLPINKTEHQRWQTAQVGAAKGQEEWNLMTKYATREWVDQVLLMYFDNLQLAFLRCRRLPFAVSGILFRPSFHYSAWGHGPTTSAQHLRAFRKMTLLRLLLLRPGLCHLFSLDPFAIPSLTAWAGSRSRVHYLPDPVPTRPVLNAERLALCNRLGIEPNRQVVLVFGQLDDRKGIVPLLGALGLLPVTVQKQWCVLLVGPIDKSVQSDLSVCLGEVGSVQVVRQHTFVVEPDIQPYFAVSDLVAVLYKKHIGMSAVLVRAAVAERPVLASDYGLIGQLVKTKQLGLTVNETDKAAIADALTRFARHEWAANPIEMQKFAYQNRAEVFSETIFKALITNKLTNFSSSRLKQNPQTTK